jgi:hypothetical protein
VRPGRLAGPSAPSGMCLPSRSRRSDPAISIVTYFPRCETTEQHAMANFPLAEATGETHGLRDQVGRRRHPSYPRSTRAHIAQRRILDRAAPLLGVPYRCRGLRPIWGRIYGRAVSGVLASGGRPASLPRFRRSSPRWRQSGLGRQRQPNAERHRNAR